MFGSIKLVKIFTGLDVSHVDNVYICFTSRIGLGVFIPFFPLKGLEVTFSIPIVLMFM